MIAPTSPRALHPVLRKIGRHWWEGEARLSVHNDWWSLERLLAPSLATALQAWNQHLPHARSLPPLALQQQRAAVALVAFARLLTKRTGITCTATRSGLQVLLRIDACPLCDAQSVPCSTWVGVVDGLLAWLHGGHAQTVVLNEAKTHDHTIVCDLLALPSKTP